MTRKRSSGGAPPRWTPARLLVLPQAAGLASGARPPHDYARVVVACGFSGGGFQFAPAIGACARACVEQAVFDDAPAPARNHRAATHAAGGDARVPIAEMCEKFRLGRFGPLE